MLDSPAQRIPTLEVRGLKKAFGHQYALRGLDLTVHAGEFVTIFGPNGAGKTTLIRILAHLVKPTAGTVSILGTPLEEVGADVRRQLGVIAHQTFLYGNLTARENLRFYGQLFNVTPLEPRIEEVLDQVELQSRADSLARTFSKGMAQRLAIARAILHRPTIILLDEPYTGLDQHAARILTSLLRQLNDGTRSLIMTTHHLEQGLELSSRICIQAAGRLVHDCPREGLTVASLGELYLERLEAVASSGRQGGAR